MAFQIRHSDEANEFPETPDINVTPFIDVMLVLLIIFMVAAPLATVNVPLELPVTNAAAAQPPADPVVLSIQADRSWSVGDRPIDKAQLGPTIDAISKGNRDIRIFVRADKSVAYQDLMAGMDALRASGYLKISLVGLESGKTQ